MELTRKEARLLFELDQNSRQSNLGLARKLRISKNTVSAMIDRLKIADVIKDFYAVIDVGKLGYRGVRVYVKLRQCPPRKRGELLDYLVGNEMTWWVGNVEGEFDVGIVVWIREAFEFESFWKEFEGKFHKYLGRACVSAYIGLYDGTFGFLEPSLERKIHHVGGYSKLEVTKNELAVLKAVSGNARATTVSLASKLNLSPLTVKECLRRLRGKEVIKGFRVRLDLSILGYAVYKMNFQVSDLLARGRMLAYALERPNVIFVDESIGFADLEVSVACKSHLEFRAFLDEFLGKFSKNISDYNYFIYLKVHKIKHI